MNQYKIFNKTLIHFWTLGISLLFLILGCQEAEKKEVETQEEISEIPTPDFHFGIDRNAFEVKEFKIKRGDTFGKILEENGIDYPEVYAVLEAIRGKIDVRKLTLGKPYTLFFSKDSITTPEYFVYHPGVSSYKKIHLRDSLFGEEVVKPSRILELEASGIIESSLYETMLNSGINESLTYYRSDVYAWTIDFFRLQNGDRFKIIYTE